MKYIVKLKSTFENVFVVDADNSVDAIAKVEGEDFPDFWQKHTGERVMKITSSKKSKEEIIKKLRTKGFI